MSGKYNNFIKNLVLIEKEYLKYFDKTDFDFRESLTGKIFNLVIKKGAVFKKSLNKLSIYFPHTSKISRDFLLSGRKVNDHIWEPQTHKLLKIICKNKKTFFFVGAFFGDHACLIAKKFKKSVSYCFEPFPTSRKFLKKNKILNNLKNIFISKKALYKKKQQKLYIKNFEHDDGNISLSAKIKNNKKYFLTDTLDDFTKKRKIKDIDLLMIDVEGNELNIFLGATNLLKNENIHNIIFEIHSKYVNWKKGLKNTSIIKILLSNNYSVFAIRDCHSNKNLRNKIELLDIDNLYLEGPHHGFNLIATKNKSLLKNKNIFFSKKNFSPKYLFHKSSKKFHYI